MFFDLHAVTIYNLSVWPRLGSCQSWMFAVKFDYFPRLGSPSLGFEDDDTMSDRTKIGSDDDMKQAHHTHAHEACIDLALRQEVKSEEPEEEAVPVA